MVTSEIRDNYLLIGDDEISFPSSRPIKFLGSGANGIVVLFKNDVLARDEAVKFWLKLRLGDSRNKIRQGMEEARKAASVNSKIAPHIYHAGILNGKYFYASTEYVQGVTLRNFLRKPRPYDDRVRFAGLYLAAIAELAAQGIVHGDAHWNNVMIDLKSHYEGPKHIEILDLGKGDPIMKVTGRYRLRLIDFGTSLFTHNGNLFDRHWRVVHETLGRFFPGQIRRPPEGSDTNKIIEHYRAVCRWLSVLDGE